MILRVIGALILTLGGCGEPLPPEFVSAPYQFKVRFGSEPRQVDQPTKNIPSRLFIVESPSGAYTVRVFALPISSAQARDASPQLLAEAKADLLRAIGGNETSSRPITLAGKYPGLEVTATANRSQPGLLRARIILAGTRLYKVSVFGTHDFATTTAADTFLESFMVLE
ncbi:MAG: hypothetical protein RMJ56_09595 [Gemmataceae bacterium]|nr:hypothetical protein [Gemmata sp.]MDW8197843.1 hypothetical protein [Gemmataceae bacterium]